MKDNKQLSIQKIIKKYENRQEKLLIEINQQQQSKKGLHQLSSTKNPYHEAVWDTPQFHQNVKNNHKYNHFINSQQNHIDKTHKKSQHFHPFNQELACISFQANSQANMEHQKVLKELNDTQQKLAKSQKDYAEIWRKCQKLLHDRQFSGLQVQIQQKLRRSETSELQTKISSLQRQLNSYKQLLSTKQQNIASFKDKLLQKSQILLQKQNELGKLRSYFQRKQYQNKQQAYKIQGKYSLNEKLNQQLQRLGKMLLQKQNQKKSLLQQLQKSYKAHKQEIQILKLGYLKVQDQYKQWIEQVSAQKLKIIQQYELKLKDNRQKSTKTSYKMLLSQQNNQNSSKRQQQLNKLYNISIKQTNELKTLRQQREALQNLKSQFIIKISVLENNLITKTQLYNQLQSTYNKLKQQYQLQQQRHKNLSKKYNDINKQFLELKNKCKIMFEENQMNKGKANQTMEIIRIRKQLVYCKQQLEKSKNNQFQLNHRFTQTVNTIKNKLTQLQSEKQTINTDLLAQRLQNVQLKEELSQTKQYLKKQYQLSLENTKRQLQKEMKCLSAGNKWNVQAEMQKQNVYCQLRKLQRKYQLMNSEVVTKDDMINIAQKIYKRYQPYKK